MIKALDHLLWRKVVLDAEQRLQKIHPNYSLCTPFGFELVTNYSKAPTNIKKLYIYSNNPQKYDIYITGAIVKKFVLTSIKRLYPSIYNDFILQITNDSCVYNKTTAYNVKESDKLLDIQVRDISSNILDDYANYIILSYKTILNKTGECNYDNPVYRSRVFQLFVMHRQLYSNIIDKHFCIPINKAIELSLPHINNSINIFTKTAWQMIRDQNAYATYLIEKYVMPMCQLIDINIQLSNNNLYSLSVASYHDPDNNILQLNMDKNLYNHLHNNIVYTYNKFNYDIDAKSHSININTAQAV